VPPYVPK